MNCKQKKFLLIQIREAEFQSLQFENEVKPEIEKIETEYINSLLERFVMNVTALNNYLKCPLEFYFKNLIRIPSPKNENTEFGSAVHYALEQLFRKMQTSDSRKSKVNREKAKCFRIKMVFHLKKNL